MTALAAIVAKYGVDAREFVERQIEAADAEQQVLWSAILDLLPV